MKRSHILFNIFLAAMAVVALVYAWQKLDIQAPKPPVSSAASSFVPSEESTALSSQMESSVAEDSMYREVRGTLDKLPLPDLEQSPIIAKHKMKYTIHDVYISKELPDGFPVPRHAGFGVEMAEDGTLTDWHSYLFVDMTVENINYGYNEYCFAWLRPYIYIGDRMYFSASTEVVTMNVNQERMGKKDYYLYQLPIDDPLRYTAVYVFKDTELEQLDHLILTITTGSPYTSRKTDTGHTLNRWSEDADFLDLTPFVFDEQGDNHENDDAD